MLLIFIFIFFSPSFSFPLYSLFLHPPYFVLLIILWFAFGFLMLNYCWCWCMPRSVLPRPHQRHRFHPVSMKSNLIFGYFLFWPKHFIARIILLLFSHLKNISCHFEKKIRKTKLIFCLKWGCGRAWRLFVLNCSGMLGNFKLNVNSTRAWSSQQPPPSPLFSGTLWKPV